MDFYLNLCIGCWLDFQKHFQIKSLIFFLKQERKSLLKEEHLIALKEKQYSKATKSLLTKRKKKEDIHPQSLMSSFLLFCFCLCASLLFSSQYAHSFCLCGCNIDEQQREIMISHLFPCFRDLHFDVSLIRFSIAYFSTKQITITQNLHITITQWMKNRSNKWRFLILLPKSLFFTLLLNYWWLKYWC